MLAKAGGQAAFQLAKRSIAQVWTRIHAMKSCLAIEAVEAGTGTRFNTYLNEAVTGAGGKALGDHANLRESALDVLESVMSKEGFDRSKFNFKAIVDHMMWRPKCKAMLANPATRAVLFDRLARLGKLLGDDVEGKFMKNFLDFAEDRLIVLKDDGAFELEWMDDWMRAFKANPSELVNRPPLESLTDNQRVFLKHILADESPTVPGKPGDFWRLDDPPWENIDPNSPHWERYRIRGILAELHLYHDEYRAAQFVHTPTARAIDYTKDITVQVKSVKNPDGSLSDMRRAMDDLLEDTHPGVKMRLYVLAKPGTDYSALEQALIDYRRDLVDLEFLDEVSRLEIRIKHYSITE